MTETFDFDAGHVALDFINTVRQRDGHRKDQLPAPADFQRWLQESGLVSGEDLQRLSLHPSFPEVHQQARALRDTFRHAIEGLVNTPEVPADLLEHLNLLLWKHPPRKVLAVGQVPLQFNLQHELDTPEALLGVLADQMANLLTLDLQGRLKKCAKSTCIRHFLDTSKNKSRNWCSMATCGNRAKAQAFYRRKVQKADESSS